MTPLARTSSNCKRQSHPLEERMLLKDYDCRVHLGGKKILAVSLKGLGREDELIGGKPPVVK
jgi:hypothetical protein